MLEIFSKKTVRQKLKVLNKPVEKPSKSYTLNATDYKKILKDASYFFLVPFGFYLVAVLGTIQLPNHMISINDFIPSNTTIIVMVAWILNQILSAIRKYVA